MIKSCFETTKPRDPRTLRPVGPVCSSHPKMLPKLPLEAWTEMTLERSLEVGTLEDFTDGAADLEATARGAEST